MPQGGLLDTLTVALTSHRYWPIWIAGLHVLTVTSHASVWLVGTFDARVYFVLESVWAPVKLVILLIGVLMDWSADHDRGGVRSS